MLKMTNLHASYDNVAVLHGIHIEVPQGSIVTLLGSNGAGKSTTLRTLSGQVKKVSGSIQFDGQELLGKSVHAIAAAGIAHCPEGRKVFKGMSVKENLLMGGFTNPDEAHKEATIAKVLSLFPRLQSRLNQDAGTLSGGEQQMLAIGRALMANPKLVVLDEPSMGLAPLIVDTVFAAIEQLKSEGITMLLVEQFARRALKIADYGYVLRLGEVVLEGPAKTLLENDELAKAYL